MHLLIFELDFDGDVTETLRKDLELFEAKIFFARVFRFPSPCISVGKNCSEELVGWLSKKFSLPVVKRPAGGGFLLHSKAEVCFSFTSKRADIERFFRKTSGCIAHVVSKEFCVSSIKTLDNGDVLVKGVKVSGVGARVKKDMILAEGVVKLDILLHVLENRKEQSKNAIANFPKKVSVDSPCFLPQAQNSKTDEGTLRSLARAILFSIAESFF